jgi:hypothetical protein
MRLLNTFEVRMEKGVLETSAKAAVANAIDLDLE